MNASEEPGKKASMADYLAAERTLLAWIRTGLALMGFGLWLRDSVYFSDKFSLRRIVIRTVLWDCPFGLGRR